MLGKFLSLIYRFFLNFFKEKLGQDSYAKVRISLWPKYSSRGHTADERFFCYFEFRLATQLKSTKTREHLPYSIAVVPTQIGNKNNLQFIISRHARFCFTRPVISMST